ncbi:hypothetical protein CapIbe_021965 [Capra ibex]
MLRGNRGKDIQTRRSAHAGEEFTRWKLLSYSPRSPRPTKGKNTGETSHFLLQGIFLTQGSNPRLQHLLHWQAPTPAAQLSHPWCGVDDTYGCDYEDPLRKPWIRS